MKLPETAADRISANTVPVRERLSFLPYLFGSAFMRGEQAVYATTDRNCPSYSGGYWEYVVLSNGGKFMYPTLDNPNVPYVSSSTGSEHNMTGEAVGISTCLLVLSAMSFSAYEDGKQNLSQLLARNFHLLRDFALDHQEASTELETSWRVHLSSFGVRSMSKTVITIGKELFPYAVEALGTLCLGAGAMVLFYIF